MQCVQLKCQTWWNGSLKRLSQLTFREQKLSGGCFWIWREIAISTLERRKRESRNKLPADFFLHLINSSSLISDHTELEQCSNGWAILEKRVQNVFQNNHLFKWRTVRSLPLSCHVPILFLVRYVLLYLVWSRFYGAHFRSTYSTSICWKSALCLTDSS